MTMRILIANDDGIDAPGLAFLEQALRAMGKLKTDIWTVAPTRKWTAASHQLSFDKELELNTLGPQRYSCSGSPADCVIAAMTLLFKARPKPDMVLSGVNDGRNAGEDAAYSGTLAIAREATFWGLPAIGFSRTKGGLMGAVEVAALADLITKLLHQRASWHTSGGWLSVNLPKHLPATVIQARPGRDKIGNDTDVISKTDSHIRWRMRRGRPQTSTPGDENSVIDSGGIAVVRHRWNMNDTLDAGLINGLQP
jgi:5'-nucleotidase